MSHRFPRLKVLIPFALCAALFLPVMTSARSQPEAADTGAQLDRLAADVQRATALRDVKRLQYLYSQFGEYGMWNDMADLFATNAEGLFGATKVSGREGIRRYLIATFGGGKDGLPVGGLYTQIFQAPVVTLSEDGNTAKGRWQELTMRGQFGKSADWSGGMQENDYVREGGAWKIARLHVYDQFAGPYETGWLTTHPRTPLVPYHYTPAQAGKPVPDLPATLPKSAPKTPAQLASEMAAVEHRILVLNEEDKVRNLQNIYGYYIDRKMWDDVTDLFTPDSAYEVAGVGVYRGPAGVRKAMEREGGPINLQSGQVHDHLQFGTIVTIADSGLEASARGMELGMLTPKLGEAFWSVSTFENHYVKIDGIWRIREMRLFPKMKTDYYQGWAKSSSVDPAPGKEFAPDQASPASSSPQVSPVVPGFGFPNPATRQPVKYPAGLRPVGLDRLVKTPGPSAPARATGDAPTRLKDAARKLVVSKAYDAIENISSTFGYYLDDFQWQNYVENYSVSGRRKKGSGGFYVGRNHIYLIEALGYGHMPPDRDGLRVHTRVQPVIDVSADAQSAYMRTRMFLYFANPRTPGAFNSGMYPNDSALVEDGVWKFNVGGSIDETYFSSNGYKDGWAKPNPAGRGARGAAGAGRRGRGAAPAGLAADAPGGRGGGPGGEGLANTRLGGAAPVGAVSAVTYDFPPDASYQDMPYRGQGFVATFPNYRSWPEIKPMWFHYKNPVSGRVPEFYCADILTCDPAIKKQ